MTWDLTRGRPCHFRVKWQNMRCSTRFHVLYPAGNGRPRFFVRSRRQGTATRTSTADCGCYWSRTISTAIDAVSRSVPTLAQPLSAVISQTLLANRLAEIPVGKAMGLISLGTPFGHHSLPPL